MHLPEVIILSCPRSGTHLLQSLLTKHPRINGLGEIFLRYEKTGLWDAASIAGKTNVAILMYQQVATFVALGGDKYDYKLIHLIRNPLDVALSKLQMDADREIAGENYRSHQRRSSLGEPITTQFTGNRGRPDETKVLDLKASVHRQQQHFTGILSGSDHLEITYEELSNKGQNVVYLNDAVKFKIISFLGLEVENTVLYTNYIKTGINR